MQFTRKGDYALRAMAYMADSSTAIPHTIDEISRNSKVPRHFLAKILKELTKADLLIAVKGAKGGYKLARKASDINLLEIVEASMGPVALNMCNEANDRCPNIDTCGLHPVWEQANRAVKDLFGQTKLSAVKSR